MNKEKNVFQEIETAGLALKQAKNQELIKAQEAFEKSGYTEDRDIAVRFLGQISTHNAYAKIGAVASLTDLIYIKENKLYRATAGLTYTAPSGEKLAVVPTWEGYCKASGLSRRTVDEQIQNSKVVGIQAYEAMVSIGVGPSAFRKLRQVPEDELAVVVQDIEVNLGDKDSILGLIDDLSAKHLKEKTALEEEINDLKNKKESNERWVADKDKKINELDRQLSRAKNKTKNWPKRTFEISNETTLAACNVLQGVDQLHGLREAIQFEDFNEEDKEAAIEAMAIVYYDSVSQVLDRAVELMNACEQVFGAYKHQARPLIEMGHIYGNQESGEK